MLLHGMKSCALVFFCLLCNAFDRRVLMYRYFLSSFFSRWHLYCWCTCTILFVYEKQFRGPGSIHTHIQVDDTVLLEFHMCLMPRDICVYAVLLLLWLLLLNRISNPNGCGYIRYAQLNLRTHPYSAKYRYFYSPFYNILFSFFSAFIVLILSLLSISSSIRSTDRGFLFQFLFGVWHF